MSFIANSPLSLTELKTSPPLPPSGTRGLFAKEDGLYEVDTSGNIKKIGGGDGSGGSGVVDQIYNSESGNAQSGKALQPVFDNIHKEINKTNTRFDNMTYAFPDISYTVSDLDSTQIVPEYKKIKYKYGLNLSDLMVIDIPVKVTDLNDASKYVTIDQLNETIGDIETALEELHTYAQTLVNGGVTV